MRKGCLLLLTLLVVSLVMPEDGQAIPAFARKYGFNCNMCHTAYPKLNDFGQRVRDGGYQIPGQEGKEKSVFDTAFPLAMRTSTGLSGYDAGDHTTLGFDMFGLDLFAGGVFHKNISFLLIYTPRMDEPAADYTGSDNGANPSQLGALESASIVFSNLIDRRLNVRVGRFEPAYHAFSSKRSYYLAQPYEIYTAQPSNSSFVFDDNQIGIEASGHFRDGIKYALGVVNGTGGSPDNNKSKDLYVNLAKTFGPGDGQSAGQRVGFFSYYGWEPLTIPGGFVSATGEADGKDNKAFYRIGANGSLNWNTFNLEVLYMRGVDDKTFNPLRETEDYEYGGGFAELDYAGLMNNRLVASLLYNWVDPPSYDKDKEVDSYSALVRYYLGGWTAVNVSMHAEYTHRDFNGDSCLSEDMLSLLIDFAF